MTPNPNPLTRTGDQVTVTPILTIIAVNDVAAAARFYREAFGWRPRVEVEVYVELELPDGRGFGLYQREAYATNTHQLPIAAPTGEITATELYLHCSDLDGAIEKIIAAGARQLAEATAKPWGDTAAYFADPDGNVIALAVPMQGPAD